MCHPRIFPQTETIARTIDSLPSFPNKPIKFLTILLRNRKQFLILLTFLREQSSFQLPTHFTSVTVPWSKNAKCTCLSAYHSHVHIEPI